MTALLPVLETVTCEGCGACCMHMGYPPFAGMWPGGDPEYAELAEVRPDLAAEALQAAKERRYAKGLPCIWLDLETRRCKHYEFRPFICYDFEVCGDPCLGHRERLGIE